jgi:hypothetical protein
MHHPAAHVAAVVATCQPAGDHAADHQCRTERIDVDATAWARHWRLTLDDDGGWLSVNRRRIVLDDHR